MALSPDRHVRDYRIARPELSPESASVADTKPLMFLTVELGGLKEGDVKRLQQIGRRLNEITLH